MVILTRQKKTDTIKDDFLIKYQVTMKNSKPPSTPPYKNKTFSFGASLLAIATVFGSVNVANAATILSTDFDGRTVSGNTASNLNWTTNGVADPGDLTADFNLFDTPDTQDLFAVQRNLHTQGPWVVDIPVVVGPQSILLDEISLDASIFSGAGTSQLNSRDFDLTIELLDSTGTITLASDSVIDQFPNSNSIPNPSPVPFSFDFAGNILSSNTTFFLRLTASGEGAGNNGGIDNFLVTGDLIASTPEPISVMSLIGVGVLGVASKLKKKV